MVSFGGTGDAAACSAVALSFLGRPLCRNDLMVPVDYEGGWGCFGSVGANAASSVVRASDDAPCKGILFVKVYSTCLASCR
jgi:hypothetical protein